MSIVFTISDASGPGKPSVLDLVCKEIGGLDLAVPYTTRTRRIDDNRESQFVFTSREAFELMITREEFLEYVSTAGNYYGTPRQSLEQARKHGNDLLIRVDDQGAAQIKQKIPDAVSILVLPGRGSKDAAGSTPEKTLFSRLEKASSPPQMPNYDGYDHVIVNDQLEDSAGKVIEVIRSERSRRS